MKNSRNRLHCNNLIYLMLLSMVLIGCQQSSEVASIQEKVEQIKTYPFGDPDPVPILTSKPEIYPFFRYDGFSHTGKQQEWKVVTLENPYIRVLLLPQVGGKVWGAIEKSTGHAFIYLNHVLKFRDIAMRGPWTSGGIEYNFGLIGHHPWTATPVDYVVKKNEDGSVSCIVGAMDLPSRTQWRVTITVPKDKAYFETKSLWYNSTPLHQSYYHWMNAAEKAGDDLEFFYPGNHYLSHDGEAHPWPVDEAGRKISWYKNNDFGGSKSYHVMGEYKQYSGGYWHNENFGFGHWAPYDEVPGRKIWIWALSRSGAIWEDLLTDTDGQYVEVQNGRMYSQANANSGLHSPFNQEVFQPFRMDNWHEIWFPVGDIGGISTASPYGIMYVTRNQDSVHIRLNALQRIADTLKVDVDGTSRYTEQITLDPMDRYQISVGGVHTNAAFNIRVGRNKLYYSSDDTAAVLDRPVTSKDEAGSNTAESLFQKAEEYNALRRYPAALSTYLECLKRVPQYTAALNRVAEIYYRSGEYRKALAYAHKALENDAYDPAANFMHGLVHQKLGEVIQAKEAFGWAARSSEYRLAAFMQLSRIALQEKNYIQAQSRILQALRYDGSNIPALQLLAAIDRKAGQKKQAQEITSKILSIDPLNHFARFEQFLLAPTQENKKAFTSQIRNELPQETYLELAIRYANMGLDRDAVQVLELAPEHPIVDYWLAYLLKSADPSRSVKYLDETVQLSPRLVYPFRLETIPVLQWALEKSNHWKTKYYLGLIYWAKGRKTDAQTLLNQCEEQPEFGPFYLTRAHLLEEIDRTANDQRIKRDLQLAVQKAPNEWRGWVAEMTYDNEQHNYQDALRVGKEAYERFPGDYIIGMNYAKTLLNNNQYDQCVTVLDQLDILPYEGAQEGHEIYTQAHIYLALQLIHSGKLTSAIQHLKASAQWPEHLGVGKPYDVDARLQEYMEAYCYRQLEESNIADSLEQVIYHYTTNHGIKNGLDYYLGVKILSHIGKHTAARQLIQKIAQNPGNVFLQWVKAKLNNNRVEIQRVERQIQTGKAAVNNRDKMLLRAIQTISDE